MQTVFPVKSVFESLDDSARAVQPVVKVAAPVQYYDLVLPEMSPAQGRVKYLLLDDYSLLPDGSDGEKVPGNCYKYWFDQQGRLEKLQGYFDTTVFFTSDFLYDPANGLVKVITKD